MKKSHLKAIIADMEAKGVPDSADLKIKMLDSNLIDINPNSYVVIGENADVSLDASDHWAGNVTEANAVFLKQI
jgi:hypothetical protein